MKEKSIHHVEREKVESVVWTFLRRLMDVNKISDRPEGAAMLSLHLLDEISGILFKGETGERVQQFIALYVPEYSDLPIYEIFRYSLDFNYSTEKSFKPLYGALVGDEL